MRTSEFLSELKRRSSLLYYSGWVMLVSFALLIPAYLIDDRTVMGINNWIKPMKFCLSIAFYVWAFAWLLHDIQRPWHKLKKGLIWTVFLSMLIEIVIIIIQAGRGVQSHFNFETSFDALMFGIMGLLVAINTIAIFILAVMYFFKHDNLHPSYLLGVRLAMIIFIAGNLIGNIMISNMQHSIGVPDGGEGLPFVNWSKVGGDLRIGHFLGLHSIQIIPLLAYWIKMKVSSINNQKILVVAVSIIYAFLVYFFTSQALAGRPLISG